MISRYIYVSVRVTLCNWREQNSYFFFHLVEKRKDVAFMPTYLKVQCTLILWWVFIGRIPNLKLHTNRVLIFLSPKSVPLSSLKSRRFFEWCKMDRRKALSDLHSKYSWFLISPFIGWIDGFVEFMYSYGMKLYFHYSFSLMECIG